MNNKEWSATDFASSVRGQYIISQALCLAIEKMKDEKIPMNMRESSNIADMEYLRDELFPIYKAVQCAQQGTLGTLSDDDGVYQECEECGGNLYRCDCLQETTQQ